MTGIKGTTPRIFRQEVKGPELSKPQTDVRQPDAKPAGAPERRSTFTSVRDRGLFSDRRTFTQTSETDTSSFKRTSNYVNGRLRNSISEANTREGNLEQSTVRDQKFGRDGTISNERLTQTVTTHYSENTSISRRNVTEGRYSNETITFQNQNGPFSRTSTVSNYNGPQWTGNTDAVRYQGGQYKNTGAYATQQYKGGRFSGNLRMDYSDKRGTQRSTTLEHDFRAGTRGTEADAARLEERSQTMQTNKRIGQGLDILSELGLKTTLVGGGKPTTTTLYGNDPNITTSADGNTKTETLLGPRVSTTQYGEVALGANGLTARGNADIRAGVYAQASGTQKTDVGTFSGSAGAKVEAYAQANGQAQIGYNGVSAQGYARVGVEASAEVNGSYKTPPITIGGTELTAGVKARGRVAAEATAEASGRVQFTGDPPTAIIQGEAGASAVVKAEGDIGAHAGPFSIKASGYVSAGAEAQASGAIGYDDGKLKLSFGAGAALGVGAGGRVQVEVDVAQIGEAAVGLAKEGAEAAGRAMDVTGDDKFNMEDVNVIKDAAVETISEGVETVRDTFNEGVSRAGEALSDAGDAIGGAISDGAGAVKDFFSGW